jgi:hypothetical protein
MVIGHWYVAEVSVSDENVRPRVLAHCVSTEGAVELYGRGFSGRVRYRPDEMAHFRVIAKVTEMQGAEAPEPITEKHIEAAYKEGYRQRGIDAEWRPDMFGPDVHRAWEQSEARKALNGGSKR